MDFSNKRILIMNCFQGGAECITREYSKIYSKNNKVFYCDVYKLLTFIPVKYRFIVSKVITPFISLFFQLVLFPDIVLMNQNLIIPLNLKIGWKGYIFLHHPYSKDVKNRKKTLVDKLLLITEELSLRFCHDVITGSEFSKVAIEKEYIHINPRVSILMYPISNVFSMAKKHNKNKTKDIMLPNIFRTDRKGGTFIIDVLESLKDDLNKSSSNLIITGQICNTQEVNFKKLLSIGGSKVLYYEDLSLETLAEEYARNIVLCPALLEGYGLVPIEVDSAGGQCISTPMPSLGYIKNIEEYPNENIRYNDNIYVIGLNEENWKNKIKELCFNDRKV